MTSDEMLHKCIDLPPRLVSIQSRPGRLVGQTDWEGLREARHHYS